MSGISCRLLVRVLACRLDPVHPRTVLSEVYALVKECDGSAAGRVQAFGNKCNPLFLTVERTDSSEANKRKLTWKQDIAGKFLPADYEGELPALADAATAVTESA